MNIQGQGVVCQKNVCEKYRKNWASFLFFLDDVIVILYLSIVIVV